MSTHLSKREFRGNTQLIVCVFVVFVGIKRETNLSKRDVRGNTQLIVCVFVVFLLILRERERERERERGPLYVHIVLAMETYIVDNQKIAKIGGPPPCQTITPTFKLGLLPLSYIVKTATNIGILNNKIGFKYHLGFFFFWVDFAR